MACVTFIFNGTGIGDYLQAKVEVYDLLNNKVYEGITKNGRLKLKIRNRKFYSIRATLLKETIKQTIYVNNCNKFIFTFRRATININRTTTFILTDSNYRNLPIAKGEILLWQK